MRVNWGPVRIVVGLRWPCWKLLACFLENVPDARETVILTLVGPEDKTTMERAKALGLEGIVVSAGQTNYEESLRYIQSASCLFACRSRYPRGDLSSFKVG